MAARDFDDRLLACFAPTFFGRCATVMAPDVAEQCAVNKLRKSYARPLADLIGKTLADAFAKQGFASTELVTRWADIVGADIAAHSEPMRIQWPRTSGTEPPEPATLVLRVEGPAAIEIQHLSGVIVERVNRFFGWQAVARIALRQAPLARRSARQQRPVADSAAAERISAAMTDISDDNLRAALGRLGAAIKRT